MASIRLTPRVFGGWGEPRWFSDTGAFGDLTWSTKHRGGSEAALWRVDSTKRLPYRPGDRVEVLHHGWPLFAGSLLEPDGDTLHARGLYYQAARAYALDGTNAATTIPDAAIYDAIVRRQLLDWRFPNSVSTAAFGEADAPMRLSDLLESWAESVGKVIRVDGRRNLIAASLPTVPRWHVTPGAAELSVAEDSYVTTIQGTYNDIVTGLPATVMVTDADAAARFGPREELVDLTKAPLIGVAEATNILTSRLAMGAARPGWANGLELASWELTSPGGAPANLRSVQGGDMIRILGQMDPTIATGPKPYIDVIADEVTYVDGSNMIQIKPVGLEARGMSGALDLALS
jgi:hypothetical protein